MREGGKNDVGWVVVYGGVVGVEVFERIGVGVL